MLFILELSTKSKEDDLRVGKPVKCLVNVKNTSKKKLTVNLKGVISSIRYTGAVWKLVKSEKFEDCEVGSGKSMLPKNYFDYYYVIMII